MIESRGGDEEEYMLPGGVGIAATTACGVGRTGCTSVTGGAPNWGTTRPGEGVTTEISTTKFT